MDDSAACVWVRVMKAADLRAGAPTAVFPKGLPVLLIRGVDGEVRAFANRCPHMGCPLSRGSLDGHILRCPCHDWRFDTGTGAFLDAPEIRLPRYELKTSDGDIHINITKAAA
ncbi:MAG TPA: Rieske (2Fe-2S) protein [Elusimicrobiales bacterium]|nr:Rieske (2Fe-2S) protein [Elusimicrobiales bacterium]